jgi:hypothetical protein
MINILSTFPLELVTIILSYDRRFSVKKLDKVKYANAIAALSIMPKIIVVSNVNHSSTYFRSFVRFSGDVNYEIEYTNFSFDFHPNQISYRFKKEGETLHKIIN